MKTRNPKTRKELLNCSNLKGQTIMVVFSMLAFLISASVPIADQSFQEDVSLRDKKLGILEKLESGKSITSDEIRASYGDREYGNIAVFYRGMPVLPDLSEMPELADFPVLPDLPDLPDMHEFPGLEGLQSLPHSFDYYDFVSDEGIMRSKEKMDKIKEDLEKDMEELKKNLESFRNSPEMADFREEMRKFREEFRNGIERFREEAGKSARDESQGKIM